IKLFHRNWKRVLNDKRFGVTEFKASDLVVPQGEFARWRMDRAEAFRLAISEVIEQFAWFGIERSVVLDDYNRVVAELLPKLSNYRDPYIWLMQSCLELACNARALRKSERIAVLFDRGHPFLGRTRRSFYELLDDPDGPIGKSGRFVRKYETAD